MKKIILGVTGSIAAYKALELSRLLKKQNIQVNVILTENAKKFVTPLSFEILTENKIFLDIFDNKNNNNIEHIDISKNSELLLIAPCTANFIAKMANGICDDMLSTTFLAMHEKPILIAPAMNTKMYTNKIFKRNLDFLIENKIKIIHPKVSKLACGDYGIGAMEEVEKIVEEVKKYLNF